MCLKTKNMCLNFLGPVCYMCLKTENCCLEIFVEILIGKKMYENT